MATDYTTEGMVKKMLKPNEENLVVEETEETIDAKEETDNAQENTDASSENSNETHYVSIEEFDAMKKQLESYNDTLQQIMSGIKSIKDAQGVMVKNGVTIQDDSEPEPFEFKPLSEMNLSIK